MSTIKELHTKLAQFDTFARAHSENPRDLQTTWRALFGNDVALPTNAAKAFATYYKEMRSKTGRTLKSTRRRSRKQRGGAAPLSYTMTPGAFVDVYGKFPVEVGTDPASIRDLDVFWQSGLTGTCGQNTAYWPTVPANMGSNQVGGKRQRTIKRRRGRPMKGGNMLESLTYRPVISTAPPNMAQIGYNHVTGVPGFAPANPVQHSWGYMSNGTAGVINPGVVTEIQGDMTKLASPAPWQTSV
jgi:hypothetical protein